MSNRWTKQEHEFVSSNFLDMDDEEMAEHIDRTATAIKTYRQRNGLVDNSHLWSDNETKTLKENYSDTPRSELLEMLPEKDISGIYNKAHSLGLEKDEEFLRKQNQQLGKQLAESDAAKATQFEKGQEPFNKGMPQEEFMSQEAIERTKETRFKPGQAPPTAKWDGAITIRYDHPDRGGPPYLYIRLSKGNWEKYQRYLWRQEHGEIPDDRILVCKNGNTLNPDPDNWELISRAEHARRNQDWEKAMKTMAENGNHPSKHLTDHYVAAQLAGGDKELRYYIVEHRPDLIKTARANYKLQRKINDYDGSN